MLDRFVIVCIGAVGNIPSICSRIPVGRIGICQCAAAIDIVNNLAATDAHAHVLRHVGLAAAAIDVVVNPTAGDGHRGRTANDGRYTETAAEDIGRCAARHCHRRTAGIGGILTAAIDIADGAAFDGNSHRLLRSAVDVVTAEDVLGRTALSRHGDSAIDVGGNRCNISGIPYFSHSCDTQTATEDCAVDSAAIEVDLRGVGVGFCRRAVDLTLCRAAIDVTVDGGIAGIGFARWCPRLRADVHLHIAVHTSGLTIAAAEDDVSDGVATTSSGMNRATDNRHRGILLQHTVNVGTAIDSRTHRAAFHRDGGIAVVLCCNT